MSKRLLATAAAAASLAATAAAAASHPVRAPQGPALPDFPRDAQAGACYARIPAAGMAHAQPGAGPAVWTVRRGAGPTAVWSYSHGGSPGTVQAAGPLRWAQVDCGSGRPVGGDTYAAMQPPPMAPHAAPPPPFGAAQIPPPPPAPPPPPPPPGEDLGPYADGPPPAPVSTRRMFRVRPMPGAQLAPGPEAPPPPPPSDLGPYADAGPIEPIMPHAAPPPMAGPHPLRQPFGPAQLPPGFAPHPPGPPPAAPWFGGRMLTWPGKTLR